MNPLSKYSPDELLRLEKLVSGDELCELYTNRIRIITRKLYCLINVLYFEFTDLEREKLMERRIENLYKQREQLRSGLIQRVDELKRRKHNE